MVIGKVINGTETIALALVYNSSLRSTSTVHLPHNIFQAEKNILINNTTDKNKDIIKQGNKLEI